MTTFTIRIPVATINAFAKYVAPKDDVRFYLKGVAIQCDGSHAHMVATDGRILAVHRIESNDCDPFSIIVPRELCLDVKPLKRVEFAILSFDSESKIITISYGPKKYFGEAIDAVFPDWITSARRLPPVDGKPAQFNPHLASSLSTALRIAEGHSDPSTPLDIGMRGEELAGSMVISQGKLDIDIFGIIMPMRCDYVSVNLPQWTMPKAQEQKAS